MTLADASLSDRYRLERGRVFLTGVQALTRLPMLQRGRDRAAGLSTAGYVSGYRGSPLGGLDTALHEARQELEAHDVRFHPAVNEDLAATAIWGTQQLHLLPGARRDGIFSMWYGKGPGVDRSADVFKHANHAGTARHGGVLVVAGDDHAARSSAVAHQSEHVFSACAIPVLAPAGVQDILDFGLHGWAMSRWAGLWVGLKLSSDVVESSATVDIDPDRVQPRLPTDFELPADGVHLRWPDPAAAQELRMQATKIYAAVAYARANGLNRVVVDSRQARLGLVACGKAWLDLRQAMAELGLDDARCDALGLRVLKVGMPWPLEADSVRRFASGLQEILVVEEKRQIIEYQLKEMLYDWRDNLRPRVLGKFDEAGEWPAPHAPWLLPPTLELTPALVARALAARLARLDPGGGWLAHPAARPPMPPVVAPLARTPYFCSGCPHNRSTRVPEGSCAFGGVGCHLMAVWMERRTLTISQMGGEGVTWVGMAEHAGASHVFANMGDGTYFHSGLLAIRAAVAAEVNITYKLLYNDAVAMTGGQPIDGPLTVPQITRQLAAEGVARIVVLADDPGKYRAQAAARPEAATAFAPGVSVLPRDRLDAVQQELRAVPGTTVLIYDQTCATEARRRRKRGTMPALQRQVVIHEAVCEGCGDCGIQSNCLSVVPLDTPFGRKRAIDPYTCNLDLGCLEGCCPALVALEGATLRRSRGTPLPATPLPDPALPALDQPWSLLLAGVGGTGVVTVGALLGMAAHLEGKGATVLDQTGLAQKGGAVLTHVRLARQPADLYTPRIDHADVLLACDLLVAAAPEVSARIVAGRTRAVINSAAAMTGELLRHPEQAFPHEATLAALQERLPEAAVVDATALATRLAGHSIATNLFIVGYAWQLGLIPIGRDAILRAIELNAVAVADNRLAFEWGRHAAHDGAIAARAGADARPVDETLESMIARRRRQLVDYQGETLARRYEAWVQRVRDAEDTSCPGSRRLTRAVAQQAWRLLAVKDEYEVARLLADPSWDARLAQTYEGDFHMRLYLTLPWQRAAGPAQGRPRKRAFGPWLRPMLALLARARGLRGTPFDPFGWSAERRIERRLATEYEHVVSRLLARLDPVRLDAAVAIAELPDGVRGFGPVKMAGLKRMREALAARLAAYEAQSRPEAAAGADPDPATLPRAA